ncbi:MAG: TolC family protein, partial [Bacteroidota bacterium]
QNEIQDTVRLSLQNAEETFIKGNLQLIAARFNISASEAAIVQSRLWNNPNISIEQNIYNQYTKRVLDVTSSGNTGIQLQQLIVLAGKRDKQIQLASINKEVAEYNCENLLRTLKYELRTDFYDLYFLQQSLKFYDQSIPSVKKAIGAIEDVYSNRSILLSEILRLKSLLFTLNNERLEIANHVSEIENDLRVLMDDPASNYSYYRAIVDTAKLENIDPAKLNRDEIEKTALENRPDYKIASANIRLDEINLKLQNALSIPDLTVGGLWSRQGGYIPDYYALTLSIDLPIFNRNQGNIQVAENNLKADAQLKDQSILDVERSVRNAYEKAFQTDKLYKSFDKTFASQYQKLVDGMVANYQKRYITIIEFTDFYESYRNSVIQLNQLRNDRVDAFEALNYQAGSDVIK